MTYGLPDSALLGTAKRISSLARTSRGGGGRGKLAIDFSYKFTKIVIRKPELDMYLNNPRGTVGRFLRRRGNWMVAAAKNQVGRDTGALQRSIGIIHNRDGRSQFMKIGSSQPHALVHHEGSKPHVITPNEANILRFSAGGRIVYTHKVNHPGTRPNKYLSDQLWMVKI